MNRQTFRETNTLTVKSTHFGNHIRACNSVALLLTLFIAALFLQFDASAKAESQDKPTAQIFTIGVEDINYYPYWDFVDRKPGQGILRSILDDFALRHNYQFNYVALPTMRLSHWFDEHKVDFRIPDNPRWHKATPGNLIFSKALLVLPTGTVVLKKNIAKPIDDFMIIGTLTGFTPSPHWLDASKKQNFEFITDQSIKVLVRLLFKGVLDGLDLDLYTVRHHALQMGMDADNLVYARDIPDREIQYYISTINHSQIIEQFNAYLEENRAFIQNLQVNGIREFDLLTAF
ncbi:MAG: polar amino acid transport system substrate-binding protein [Paraglaciecola sp.]